VSGTFVVKAACTAWLLTVGQPLAWIPEAFLAFQIHHHLGLQFPSVHLHHWQYVKDAHNAAAKVIVIDT